MSRLRLATSAAVLAVSLTACSSSSGGAAGGSAGSQAAGSGLTPVRVAYVLSGSALPYWVADAQGFFKNHGLDIKGEQITDLTTLPPALGKQYDIGLSLSNVLISAANSGIKVEAIAGALNDTADKPQVLILTRADSGLKSLNQLAGKRVATISPVSANTLAANEYFAQHGVDPKKINYVQVPIANMADQLKAGVVDAVIENMPFAAAILATGANNLGDPLRVLGDEVPGSFYIASTSWVDQHADVGRAFHGALSDAVKWIQQHDAEAKQILQQKTGLPAAVVQNNPLPALSADISEAQIGAWLALTKKYATQQITVDVSDLVATDVQK